MLVVVSLILVAIVVFAFECLSVSCLASSDPHRRWMGGNGPVVVMGLVAIPIGGGMMLEHFLESHGVVLSDDLSVLITIVIGLASIIGGIVGLFLADRFDRKHNNTNPDNTGVTNE